MSPRDRFALTVVVATLDRYATLDRCLDALSPAFQTAVDAYDVLVVDQTPRDRRVETVFGHHPHVTVIRTDQVGLAAARNAGAEQAQSEIVAFIDDDALADRLWVEMTLGPFQGEHSERVLISGGRVHADYDNARKPLWLAPPLERYLSCLDFGDEAGFLRKGQWLVGANLAVRKRILLGLGGFNTSLGRRGSQALLSNEEAELVRMVGNDHVFYNPSSKVKHLIPAERLHQAWFRKRVAWQAVSDVLSGSNYLDARLEARRIHTDADMAARSISGLFENVTSYELLESQLTLIYDLTCAQLQSGNLEINADDLFR